jgi:hypothetical protein
LASHSEVAAPICGAIADGRVSGTVDVRRLCTFSGLSGAQVGAVTKFLEAARTLGLVEKGSELNWKISNNTQLAPLAAMLQAAVYNFRLEKLEVARNETFHAKVVLAVRLRRVGQNESVVA